MLKRNKIVLIIIGCILILIFVWHFFSVVLKIKVNKTPVKYTQQTEYFDLNFSKSYDAFSNKILKYATVPGLSEGAIPQGICYSEKYDMLIISAYHKGKAPSVLFFIDYSTKKLEKTIILGDTDGNNYNGHAGGVATDNETLWLANDYDVFSYSMEELISLDNMKIATAKGISPTITKADFIEYNDGVLWVGEYYYKFLYPTKKSHYINMDNNKNHALLTGFKNNEDLMHPDYVISIPGRVQGLAVTKKGDFIFSQSFWIFQSSNLLVFKDVLNSPNDYEFCLDKNCCKMWYLYEDKSDFSMEMPPMSESLELVDDNLYIIFESASNLYKFYTHDKINYIVELNIK